MTFWIYVCVWLVFNFQIQQSECVALTKSQTSTTEDIFPQIQNAVDPSPSHLQNGISEGKAQPVINKNRKPKPSLSQVNTLNTSPLADVINAASNGSLRYNLPQYVMPLLMQIIRPMMSQMENSHAQSNDTFSSPLMDLIKAVRLSSMMAAPVATKRRAQLQTQIQKLRDSFSFGQNNISGNSRDANESVKMSSPVSIGGFASGLANFVRCSTIDRFNGACA